MSRKYLIAAWICLGLNWVFYAQGRPIELCVSFLVISAVCCAASDILKAIKDRT